MAARYRTSVRVHVDVFGEYDATTEDEAVTAAIADAVESVLVKPCSSSVYRAEWFEASTDPDVDARAFAVVSKLDS